jgi:hypothetical protein
MRANRFAVVLAAGLAVLGCVRLAAQSLGDVAKKEEERRKQVASSGKVYTNKDLAPAPPSSAPPPPSTPTTGDSAASKDADKSADEKAADKDAKKDKDDAAKDGGAKKDQAYWSGRMKAARDAVERDSTLVDAMQSRINALNTDFVNRDDPAQRAQIDKERQRAMAELDRLKKSIVQGRKTITDIEEEARRAGVPPGWLR